MTNETILKENDADLEHADSDDNAKERRFSDCAGRKKTQINILELIPDIFLKGYNLDDKDTEIINILFNSLLNGTDGVKAVDILKHFNEGKSDVVWEIKRLARLKQLEILKINGNQDDNTDSAGAVLRSTFKLSNDFLSLIYSVKDTADNITGYKDNFEYLSEQFERIRFLREPRRNNKNTDKEELKKVETKIANRLSKTDKTFFFEELKKGKNLNRKEELIILTMLESEIVHGEDRICIDEILDVVSKTPYEKLGDRKLLQKDSKLFKKKIIETDSENHTIRGRRINSIRLNEKLKTKLLGEKRGRGEKREKYNTNGFFEVVKQKYLLIRLSFIQIRRKN